MPGRFHTITSSDFGGWRIRLYDEQGKYVKHVQALTITRAEQKGSDWDEGVEVMSDWF